MLIVKFTLRAYFDPKQKQIIEEIELVQPTFIQATPSFYQMLYNEGWKGDKTLKILCGGDLLSEALVEKLLETTQSV